MAQLNNLIVTGSSRFLNVINGVCTDGTAGTTKFMRQDGTWQVPPNDNTDTKVTQTATTNINSNYEVIFSGSASATTQTEGVRKTNTFLFNPYQKALTIGDRTSGSTVGETSVVIGENCSSTDHFSYAEGESNVSSGYASHAEGTYTTASESEAHAEGYSTTASGSFSHAEGSNTTASGSSSHAEGGSTTASGNNSHAEGLHSTASGYRSHAEGDYTIANHLCQHVFGTYNIEDPSTSGANYKGNYIEIVGNGGSSERSNARTLDWNGNEWLAGNLTLAGTLSDVILSGTNNTWDGTNTSLKTAVTTLTSRTYFGTCDTASGTDAKVVVCPEFTTTMANCPIGTMIKVHFTKGCQATAPTLNVNSKGAVTIYKYGTTIGLLPWRANSIVTFTYDGTYWRMNDINDFASLVQRSLLTSESADYFYPMIGNNHGSDPSYASLFTNGAFRMALQTGTTATEGMSRLDLGNNTAAGTAGNTTGSIRIFSNTTKYGTIAVNSLTANRTYTFPDKTGTVALTSDIPTTESSIKVKKNISAISEEEVNSILKLNAVKFDFKSSEENNAIHRGFIAEDVAKILPNLVTDEVLDDDGNLVDPARLNYMEIIPYLVEVCKRQQKEIDELKKVLNDK